MKTCRMMFYSDYVSDEQLIKAVQNSSHLNKCYVGVHEKTWTNGKNTTLNYSLLKTLKTIVSNVEIVHLEDKILNLNENSPPPIRESHTRNYILDIAKNDSFDFMIIQDTDEFMIKEDYFSFVENYAPQMVDSGYDSCAIRWKNFWKNWNTILICEKEIVPNWPGEWATFGISLNSNVKFTKNRHHTFKNKCAVMQPWYLYHGAYVLNNEQVLKKIKNWGHAMDAEYSNLNSWYEEKWLKWTPETTDLHPSNTPSIWTKAVPYEGPLPEELIDYKI